jgi:uncharacterized protein YkwD
VNLNSSKNRASDNMGDAQPSFNYDNIEDCIHEEVNQRRLDHGLGLLEFDFELSSIARKHSADMAERQYFAHESPEGDDFADRYREAGYDCLVRVSNGRYLQGAENIGKTYLLTHLEGGKYNETADDVAEGIVDGWMDSPSHRENILMEHWNREGIGISLTDEDGDMAVYATQNFC